MSDDRARISYLDTPSVGHHNIAILPPHPTTGLFPIRAADHVLFNSRPARNAADQIRVLPTHEPVLPLPDSRFFNQQLDGVTAMTMAMLPRTVSAIPVPGSFPSSRIPFFPPLIAAPTSYNRRCRDPEVEVQLAAARMKEATSLLLWASLTQASGMMTSSISPTFWPALSTPALPRLVLPRAIDPYAAYSSPDTSHQDNHYISQSMKMPGVLRDSINAAAQVGLGGNASMVVSPPSDVMTKGPLLQTQQHGPENFPMILQRLLANLELVPGGTNIISFLPDGLSFVVKNQHVFSKEVLPIYFPKMKSFASFQRQLNLYDFKRVGGVGSDQGAYRHKSFLRDNPSLSSSMRRTKIKGVVAKTKVTVPR